MLQYQKIVLAGGNGYLGKVLANHYKNLCHQVIILSRKPAATVGNVSTVLWDGKSEGSWERVLDGADMLINLCGKNVNCRYTEQNKKAILQSRLVPTALLGRAIGKLTRPPKLWINVTSSTIYRHAEDRAQDEMTGEIGRGFSVDVCKHWEQTFLRHKHPIPVKWPCEWVLCWAAMMACFRDCLTWLSWGLAVNKVMGSNRYHGYTNWM